MGSRPDSASSREGAGRVLLVGDVHRVFLDADCTGPYPCEVAASLLDAVDIAVRGDFGVVGIVMNGTAGRLHAALRALRYGTHAHIVLLAQMHEEPIARRLVAQESPEEKLADAYLVCPTRLALLCDHAAPVVASGMRDQARPTASPGPTPPDVAQLQEKIRHLEYLATTDDLTGLKNRRYILEFAGQALQRAAGSGGRVTLLLFDIDNFKCYNDTCGHLAGDEILRQAGILMRRCCRPHDVIARIGGDEFAVVFWDDPYKARGGRKRERRSAAAEHPAEAISLKHYSQMF